MKRSFNLLTLVSLLALTFSILGITPARAADRNLPAGLSAADWAQIQAHLPNFSDQQKLTASDGAAYDQLGSSISISADGTTVVIGAPGEMMFGSTPGAAYVFTKSGESWSQAAKLTASDGAVGDKLGASVAVSSDGATVVVGASEAAIEANGNQGAVYVFTNPGGSWTDSVETAKLTASDGTMGAWLGMSVAVSADGTTVIAGATHATVGINSPGAVYVFTKPGGIWADGTQTAKLTSSDGAENDQLGFPVSISADGATAVAGAAGAAIGGNVDQGAIYVFTKPGGNWADGNQTAKLIASDGAASDYLGHAAAISGDGTTVAAGLLGGSTNAAYVFVKPGGGWADGAQTAKLTSSDNASYLSWSVAVNANGGTVVTGAAGAVIGDNPSQGAVYVFARAGGGWADGTENDKLITPDGATNDQLGFSVAISENGASVATGAYAATIGSNDRQGAAYVFSAPTVAPTVATTVPSGLTSTHVTLHGTVNANNSDTTVTFEVGLDNTYGVSFPADEGTVIGASDTPVSVALMGLTAGTTYHYRVVAANTGGTTYGDDLAFTAAPSVTNWVHCADESGTCSFSGTKWVRYGDAGTGAYAYGQFTGSVACETASFGYDPIMNTAKTCDVENNDTTPPNTSIVTKPTNPTTAVNATFAFTGTDNLSATGDLTFFCKVDALAYRNCGTAYLWTNLSVGQHTFRVYAVDEAGNADPTPAVYSWWIQTERIKNGGFNTYVGASKVPQFWTKGGTWSATDGKATDFKKEGAAALKFVGQTGKTKTITQTMTFSGTTGNLLRFSFWAKGATIPAAGVCKVELMLYNGATLTQTKVINCKPNTYNYVKQQLNFYASSNFTKVVVKMTYSKASGTIWFDLMSLLK